MAEPAAPPPPAPRRTRPSRLPWVLGVTALVFFACWSALARTDSDVMAGKLCKSHKDLKCAACHEMGSLSQADLVKASPPRVDDNKCFSCHQVIAANGGRRIRPAHGGETGWATPSPAGLISTQDGLLKTPLQCGSCHPEHKGRDFPPEVTVQWKVDDKTTPVKKVRVQEACVACHVPAADGEVGQTVRSNFVTAHNGEAMGVYDTEIKPEGATQAVVLEGMSRKQTLCISCHGEHTPHPGGFEDKEKAEGR